jgi:hypothetical protein
MRRKKKALRGPFLHNPRHSFIYIYIYANLILCESWGIGFGTDMKSIDITAGIFCYLGIFMVFVKM